MRLKTISLVAIVLCLTFGLSATAAALVGEVIVSGKCTACHNTDYIKNDKDKNGNIISGQGAWAVVVDKAINQGAQLNSDERSAAIQYLAANYGASAQTVAQTQPAVSPAPTTPAATSTIADPPKKQAYTGVEMWQLVLAGSSFMGSGVYLRRKK